MSNTVTLHKGREKSLLRHHPWIFTSAIKQTSGKNRSGETVDIVSSKGEWLARGAWSGSSSIRVRVWTFEQNEVIDNAFFLRRIESAIKGRNHLGQLTNACRLVAAEADGLPGIIVDRYDDLLVCQLLSAGAEKHRDKLVWALQKLLPECSILERSDAAVREKEGLPQLTQELHGTIKDEVEITEHGLRFLVNPRQGHKTGFYLDQRENRRLVAQMAAGRDVLNCFSYTGGFAVHCLAAGAASVCNLDVSADALQMAERNITLNGLDASLCQQSEQDVFAALRAFRAEGRRFDLIILDPPKFADNKQHLHQAARGYKDINWLALQLLNPEGLLATFSCSGLMPVDLFHKIVADAALDAGRQVQFLRKMSQDSDHPVSSACPEGYYLKGLLCRVV